MITDMHRRRWAFAMIAIAATFLPFFVAPSTASPNCKTFVMSHAMKQCSGYTEERQKRGVERLGVVDSAHAELKLPERTDASTTTTFQMKEVNPNEKREISASQIASMTLPIVNDAVHGVIKVKETSEPDVNQEVVRKVKMLGNIHPPLLGSSVIAPSTFRHPEFGDDLGLDLDNEELEQLYEEMYWRMPRSSKDEVTRYFKAVAAKCCQYGPVCLKNIEVIPCPRLR